MNKNDSHNNINNINDNKNNENDNIYQIIINKLNQNKLLNNNKEVNQHKLKNDEKNNSEEKEIFKKNFNEKQFSHQILSNSNEPDKNSSINNMLIKKSKKINHKEEYCSKKYNKNYKSNPMIDKKKEIPYSNKNKGLFDPFLTKRELDYESNIKKQREERKKKIDEYEKKQNQKKLQKDINNKILNTQKPKIKSLINAKNFAQKQIKKNDEDLVKHFMKVPKPKLEKRMAKNFGFNPKKYDMIINSLLNEINEVKKERKIENEMFKKKFEIYTKENVDKYNNYYEFIFKKQKLNYEKQKVVNSKNTNYPSKPTKAQIINSIMKKYFDKDNPNLKNINENEILKEINLGDKNINGSYETKKTNHIQNEMIRNNNINNILFKNQGKIDQINFDNIDKLLSSNNLTFQDKINVLTELNNNLDNYYKEIPSFVNQVKTSINKLYDNDINNNFIKEANKVPFVAMASKAAFQIIQTNNAQIIEDIIDELLYECTYEINAIDENKKKIYEKKKLLLELDKAQEKINKIPKNEEEKLDSFYLFLQKNNNDLKHKINNEIIDNNKDKIEIIKFNAFFDDNYISERNKFKNEFRTYMEYKGSFYYNDIFNIYDQFIEEEARNIMNEIVDNYVNDIHNHSKIMAINEINSNF